jgi:5-formyltetrahydrofolate cyclo-ligase
VAYACQEADHVPTEPHDQRLDYLMTERETIIPA